MKITLVSFSELPTLQRHLYLLCNELSSRNIETWTIGSASIGIDVELGERNILVQTPDSPKPSLPSLRAIRCSLDEIADTISRINPEVIHFVNKHTWNFFLLRRLRKILPETKYIHTFHDPIGHEGDSIQKGVMLYHKVIQRMLDGIVVHSDIAHGQTVGQLKPSCPVCQVPLGEKVWHEYRSPSSAKNALVFGRLNYYKGLKHYPSILKSIYSIDPEVTIMIAGKAADEVDAALLKEISDQPNCTLINGFIPEGDIDRLFRETNLVLAPYASITQSGVILDAYSRSKCVICFDIAGISQFIPDETCRVEPFDCERFAELACMLLSNRDGLETKSRRVWEFGKKNFTPEVMADSLLSVYESLIV